MIGSRTAAKNVPVSFPQLSTTTMPFLYQTRTLSSITWKGVNAAHQSCFTGRCKWRNFSCFTQFQHLAARSVVPATTSASRDTGTDGRPFTEKTIDTSERSSASSWASDREKISFRDSIDGQEGFVIRKQKVKSFELENVEGLEGNVFPTPETIEFDEDLDNNLSNRDEIQQLTNMHQNRGSTITISERRAFQKIFSDMFESSHLSGFKKDDLLIDDSSETDDGLSNKRSVRSRLSNILTRAMRRERETPEGVEAAVERYPPALRAAAARAMGLIDDEATVEEATSRQGKALGSEELEVLREPERARVEGLMKNAQSDFELWEILEKEVFPLIAKLGLEDPPTVHDTVVPKGAMTRKKLGKKSIEVAELERKGVLIPHQSSLSETENGVSPLSLYGPLYPSYLLLGLRLLDRGFAKPSPLALSMLPRIKSLGFISHVLGASTQFYNELLRIYRYRQDDFRSIINLLTEMEDSALDADEETLQIVLGVIGTQRSVLRGEKGPAIQALWSMPEFAPNKFRASSIQRAIGDKEEANRQLRY